MTDDDATQAELLAWLANRLAELLVVPEAEQGETTQAEATRLRVFLKWVESR